MKPSQRRAEQLVRDHSASSDAEAVAAIAEAIHDHGRKQVRAFARRVADELYAKERVAINEACDGGASRRALVYGMSAAFVYECAKKGQRK